MSCCRGNLLVHPVSFAIRLACLPIGFLAPLGAVRGPLIPASGLKVRYARQFSFAAGYTLTVGY